VKKRLRPLALQATAAERAEKLRAEIAGLEARVAQLDLATVESRLAEGEERRTAAKLARRRADEQLEGLLAERTRVEEELADAAGKRESATAALYRLRSAAEHNLPYELLAPEATRERFPAFRLADDLVAVLDPRAGYLDPEACNKAPHKRSPRSGG